MFDPKDQIACVPLHAFGDIHHPDVEFGFVSEDTGADYVRCRYWSKYHNGLRTLANSENTPREMLVPYTSHTFAEVDAAWEEIYPHE